MSAADLRGPGETARENDVKRLEDRALGLRIVVAGMRPEKYRDTSELKIRARKAAQLAAVQRWLLTLRQPSLW